MGYGTDEFKDKLNKIFKNMLNKSGKDKILIVILIGILFLIVSIPTKKKSESYILEPNDNQNTNFNYEEYMEDKLEGVLSQVYGVGKVRVIISLKNSGEKIIAQDEKNESESIQESDNTGGSRITSSNSIDKTNIYYDSNKGNAPFVKSENTPDVDGVIIVAKGGGDGKIVADITSAVESLLGVPVHKIKVLKME